MKTEQITFDSLLSKPSISDLTDISSSLSGRMDNTIRLIEGMEEKINDIEETISKNKNEFSTRINNLIIGVDTKFDSYHREWFESLSKVDNKLSDDMAEIKARMYTLINLQKYVHNNTKFSKLKKIFLCNEGKNHTYKTELHHPNFVTVNKCEVCGEIEITIVR